MRKTFLSLMAILTCSVANGLPTEGFESFTLYGNGTLPPFHRFEVTHQKPVWRNEFQNIQYVGGTTLGENYLSYGARTTLGPQWGDRDAYFLRYDYTIFKVTSLAVKLMHENWRYISTSKDTFGLEYNAYFGFQGQRSGAYFSFGGYYRWLKQSWNDPWWSPMNLNTEDQEGYFQFVFGWQKSLGSGGSFLTLDINNRDAFSYYTMDNLGFDLALNLDSGGIVWRAGVGARTSALTMGTGSTSETYGSLGILIH
jgi:hypothetical protein